MAVFAPMPSASVSTATAVKPGFFRSWRKANLISLIWWWKARARYEFPLAQALFTIWFRRAHVIESKFFCITCAISQTKAMKFPTSGK